MQKKTEDMLEAKNKSTKKINKSEIDQALLDNFINLQKVLTNLSVRFEELSNNISKLLQLFEISAKSFTEKPGKPAPGVDKEFLEKLDSLLEQNKVISKGIMMMEDRVRGRMTGKPAAPIASPGTGYSRGFAARPLPR